MYLAGVDKTQSIALDEIFGKKMIDVNGDERATKTYRKTRVNTSQVGKTETERKSLNDETEKADNEI